MDSVTKPRRTYKKRNPEFPAEGVSSEPTPQEAIEIEPPPTPAPVVVAPPPPNPAVIALQEDIVRLIRSRGEIRMRVHQAHAAVLNTQNAFQIAQGELKALEEEIQYLHGQCAQLDGRRAEITASAQPDYSNLLPMPGGLQGISSEPTMPQQPRSFAPPDGVNRMHATREVI